MLKYFKVDKSRHDKVVDVEFYQMNLIKIVERARMLEPEMFVENGVYLPGWSKFAADPIRAKGFWTRMLEAIFLGQHGVDSVNVDIQFRGEDRKYRPGQRVAMMFLSINNDELEVVAGLTRDALPGFVVVPIGGAFGIKNATAEAHTRAQIEIAKRDGKNVLILSGGMAQRSYSIPEITELYLAYDAGEAGSTIQKMSRALTADEVGKVGRIISLSFDPNRDDRFDAMIITTAKNYKKTHDLPNLKEALRKVISTVDIFRCTDDGRSPFEFDTYLKHLQVNNSLTRLIGKTADFSRLTEGMIEALAGGNGEYFRNARVEGAEKGRATKPRIPQKRLKDDDKLASKAWEDMMKKAREVVTTISENIDILVYGIGAATVDEMLDKVDSSVDWQEAVMNKFGVEYDVIRFLFKQHIINPDLVELIWETR
jgi:hypothetical protein